MKVLMISTDRKIFEDGRGARSRMIEYGALVRELHIVVFVAKEIKIRIGNLKSQTMCGRIRRIQKANGIMWAMQSDWESK